MHLIESKSKQNKTKTQTQSEPLKQNKSQLLRKFGQLDLLFFSFCILLSRIEMNMNEKHKTRPQW